MIANHAFEFDGNAWRWLAGQARGDVLVTTTARRWATLLFNLQTGSDSAADDFTGNPNRAREFKALAHIR